MSPANKRPKVVVTGVDRGLGREFVEQYAAAGWKVVATCLLPDSLQNFANTSIETHLLDVADASSIDAFARCLSGEPLDLLINNAGMMDPRDTSIETLNAEDWIRIFRVNSIAPLLITRALVEELAAAPRAVAATIGSQAGIPGQITNAANVMYSSSKAAAHAVAISMSHMLRPRGIAYVSLRPGSTRTTMGGARAPYEVSESVALMRQVLAGVKLEHSGLFLDRSGIELPYGSLGHLD